MTHTVTVTPRYESAFHDICIIFFNWTLAQNVLLSELRNFLKLHNMMVIITFSKHILKTIFTLSCNWYECKLYYYCFQRFCLEIVRKYLGVPSGEFLKPKGVHQSIKIYHLEKSWYLNIVESASTILKQIIAKPNVNLNIHNLLPPGGNLPSKKLYNTNHFNTNFETIKQ